MTHETPQNGMLGMCAPAPALRPGARAAAASVAKAASVDEQAAQAGLFEPEARGLTPDEAREERRRGRPKGSVSLKTADLARLAAALGADPHHWQLRYLQLSPEELAARLGCKLTEAFDRQMALARELAPYFRPKLAPVDESGKAVPAMVFVSGGGPAQPAQDGPRKPAWVLAMEEAGVTVRFEENQWFIEGEPANPHGDAPNGGEKQ